MRFLEHLFFFLISAFLCPQLAVLLLFVERIFFLRQQKASRQLKRKQNMFLSLMSVSIFWGLFAVVDKFK